MDEKLINSEGSEKEISGRANRIIGEAVTLRQGVANSVEANELLIRQGGALSIKSDHMALTAGAVGLASTEEAEITTSTVGLVLSKGETNLDLSTAQLVGTTGNITMDQSASVAVIGNEVEVQDSAVVFLIAKNVSGNVHPLFSTKDAILFGIIAGGVFSAVNFLSRLFFPRKR